MKTATKRKYVRKANVNKDFETKLEKRLAKATKYKEVAKLPPYKAIIKILGKNYTAYGFTASEAVKALQVGKTAKGVSVLEVSRVGGRSKSVILPHFKTARLFSAHPMTREVALKGTSLFFDNL